MLFSCFETQKMEPQRLFSFNQKFFFLPTKIVGRTTKIVGRTTKKYWTNYKICSSEFTLIFVVLERKKEGTFFVVIITKKICSY